MPIQRSRQHGARKAARIISRSFAKITSRQNRQQELLDTLCNRYLEIKKQREQQQQRIERVERNLDNATGTLSDEVDRLSLRITGLALALIIFGVLLTAAIVIVGSKINA